MKRLILIVIVLAIGAYVFSQMRSEDEEPQIDF
jgi:hypothetical protein